jgi:hypothetical protein
MQKDGIPSCGFSSALNSLLLFPKSPEQCHMFVPGRCVCLLQNYPRDFVCTIPEPLFGIKPSCLFICSARARGLPIPRFGIRTTFFTQALVDIKLSFCRFPLSSINLYTLRGFYQNRATGSLWLACSLPSLQNREAITTCLLLYSLSRKNTRSRRCLCLCKRLVQRPRHRVYVWVCCLE